MSDPTKSELEDKVASISGTLEFTFPEHEHTIVMWPKDVEQPDAVFGGNSSREDLANNFLTLLISWRIIVWDDAMQTYVVKKDLIHVDHR